MLWILLIISPIKAWKAILDKKPYSDYMFWLIIAISSALGSILGVVHPYVGLSGQFYRTLYIFGLEFITGFFILYIVTAVLGVLAKWLGSWFDGSGSFQKLQAVLIWSGIPYLYSFYFWLIVILTGGKPGMNVYVYDAGKHVLGYLMLPWLSILVGLGYAEAHGISTKKGLLIAVITYLIPSLILYRLF